MGFMFTSTKKFDHWDEDDTMTEDRLHTSPFYGAFSNDQRFPSKRGAEAGTTGTRGKANHCASSAKAGKWSPKGYCCKEGIVCGFHRLMAASALPGKAEVGSAGTQPMEE
jgi:hypothetical protein